jgi:hypothetical protein
MRAYVSRSFHRPIWEGMLSNPAMQKAIFLAQAALYIFICVPGLSNDVMKLDGRGLPWVGWVAGIGGGFGCLTLCELYKPFVKRQIEAHQKTIPTFDEQIRKYHDNGLIHDTTRFAASPSPSPIPRPSRETAQAAKADAAAIQI